MFSTLNVRHYAKRYTVDECYNVVRFFSPVFSDKKFHNVSNLISLLKKRKINPADIDYEFHTITATKRIPHNNHHVFFEGYDKVEAVTYLNVYSTIKLNSNENLDGYYQWVNMTSLDLYTGVDYVFMLLASMDQMESPLAHRLITESVLVI